MPPKQPIFPPLRRIVHHCYGTHVRRHATLRQPLPSHRAHCWHAVPPCTRASRQPSFMLCASRRGISRICLCRTIGWQAARSMCWMRREPLASAASPLKVPPKRTGARSVSDMRVVSYRLRCVASLGWSSILACSTVSSTSGRLRYDIPCYRAAHPRSILICVADGAARCSDARMHSTLSTPAARLCDAHGCRCHSGDPSSGSTQAALFNTCRCTDYKRPAEHKITMPY